MLLLALACSNGDASLGSDPLESGGASGSGAADAGTSGGPAAGSGAGSSPGSSGDSGPAPAADGGTAPTADAGSGGPGGGDSDGGSSGSFDGGMFPGGPFPGGAFCGSRGLPPCPAGQFCDYPPRAQCGAADAPGICVPQPTACTREFAPVCGCDGQTYPNRCTAAAAGVATRSLGECGGGGSGMGEVCGGFAGQACGPGQYCDLAQGDGCDVADGQGVCEPQPQACTLELNPVCGCDGQTYGNACGAASQGVSVRHPGEC